MPNDKTVTPLQLWERLVNEAGLEPCLKRRPGRDADLEQAVLKQLDPAFNTQAAHPTVKALLKADRALHTPNITVEKLLIALLTSQQDFSAMMTQILETLVMAQATSGEHTLEFSFQFDSLTAPLRLTLEQFRAHVERSRQAWVTSFLLPNKQQRWEISSKLSDLRTYWAERPADVLPATPQIDTTLPTPKNFQFPFRVLEELVTAFLQRCHAVGPSRKDNFQRIRERPRGIPLTLEQEEEVDIISDATDFWDVSIVDSINYIRQGLKTRNLNPDRTYETVMNAVSLVPIKQHWVEERYKELLDILNLPTWKRRHELYSVWVGTRLLNVAKSHASQLEFHPQNNILSFAFNGKVLASYTTNTERFTIHCELRSNLVGASRKRKRAIQPDFRVLREDVTATSNDATRLVLECKHYLRANMINFSSAASDYARSCSYATVLVVNHGPVEEAKLLAAVDPSLRNRTRFIGDATAQASNELQAFLRSALFSVPATVPMPEAPHARPYNGEKKPSIAGPTDNAPPLASVRVEWDEQLQDIDLSLTLSPEDSSEPITLSFMNRGSMSTPFYAQLMEDVRTGPGAETINIYQFSAKTYEVVVRNYSHPGFFPASHLRGYITLGNTTLVVKPPKLSAQMSDWKMATLVTSQDGTVTIHT